MALEVSSTKRRKSDVQASIDVQAPTNPNNLGRFPSTLLIEIFSHFIFFGTTGKIRAENIQQIVALRYTNKTCNAVLKNWLAENAICFMREDIRFLRGINKQIFPNVQYLMLALPHGVEIVNADTNSVNYFFSPSLKTPNVRVLHVPALPSVITALAQMPKLEELNLQIACLGSEILPLQREGTDKFKMAIDNCLIANASLKTLYLEDLSDDEGMPWQSSQSFMHLGNTTIASQLSKIVWVTDSDEFSETAVGESDPLLDLAKKCTSLETLILFDHTEPDDLTLHEGHLTAFAEGCPTLTEIEYYGSAHNNKIPRNLFRKQGARETALKFLPHLKKLKLENMQPNLDLFLDIVIHCRTLGSLTMPVGAGRFGLTHLPLLSELSYLRMSNVHPVNDMHTLLGLKMPSLKEISIGIGVPIEKVDSVLLTLARNYSERLTELNVTGLSALPSHEAKVAFVHLAASFPNLTHIFADNGASFDLRPYRHPLLEQKSSLHKV